MKHDEVRLAHILDAIAQIESYVSGVSRADFFHNRMVQDAVARQLEIIGEASRQLSESFRAEHGAMPWHAIIGMRNRIAHDYLNLDLQIVWEVVQHDLPGLKEHVESLL